MNNNNPSNPRSAGANEHGGISGRRSGHGSGHPTPPDELVATDVAMLHLHLRPWIESEIYKAAADHMPVVRDDSERPQAVATAFVAMFEAILRALCSATAYQNTPRFRARARSTLPCVAGLLLLRVVTEELNDESYSPMKDRIETALETFNKKRNWSANGSVSHSQAAPPSAPPSDPSSDLSVRLCCALDRCATSVLASWVSGRMLERITNIPAAVPTGVDLDSIEIMLGDVRRIGRKPQYRTWSDDQRRIGCPVSIIQFCRAAGISKSAFYSHWYKDQWTDSSLEGERILRLLAYSWTIFPKQRQFPPK